jgi:hypothetical protein
MTHAEIRLIEEGWQALVDRLGRTEAIRFVMLLDRRTGGALQHLQYLWMHDEARALPRSRKLARSYQLDDVYRG